MSFKALLSAYPYSNCTIPLTLRWSLLSKLSSTSIIHLANRDVILHKERDSVKESTSNVNSRSCLLMSPNLKSSGPSAPIQLSQTITVQTILPCIVVLAFCFSWTTDLQITLHVICDCFYREHFPDHECPHAETHSSVCY